MKDEFLQRTSDFLFYRNVWVSIMSVNPWLHFVTEFIFYSTPKSCMKSLHLAFRSPKVRYGVFKVTAKN